MITDCQVIHVRLPATTLEALDQRAGAEFRSRAKMALALIRSALADTTEAKETAS